MTKYATVQKVVLMTHTQHELRLDQMETLAMTIAILPM